MSYDTIFWDLDGTLTDPEEGITKSIQYALEFFNIHVKDRSELRRFIGPPIRDSFRMFYGFGEKETEEAIRRYRERYTDIGIFENRAYKGIAELLRDLKNAGRSNVLATSKPKVFAERILKKYELIEYFDCLGGSELDGTRNKKEEVIEYLLEQIGDISRDNIIMIGDRKYDVIGAKKFDIMTIGVAYGYAEAGELREAGARFIADTVEEVREMLFAQ